ncbi:hypothetical protein D3C79_753550 [compost metagenome]
MHRLWLCPVLRQVDEIHQLTQTPLITPIEGKGQAGQMVVVAYFMLYATVGMLMVLPAQS